MSEGRPGRENRWWMTMHSLIYRVHTGIKMLAFPIFNIGFILKTGDRTYIS